MTSHSVGRLVAILLIIAIATFCVACETAVGVGVGVAVPYPGYGPWGSGPIVMGGPVWY